jgi:hypothetical protein
MFRHDLGVSAVIESEPRQKPLLATLPLGFSIQAYLWHATAPAEREIGVHKIQITLPGRCRGARIHIRCEPGRLVLFCGFAAQFDTWILWDAELFMVREGISYSRNLGVSVEALAEAVVSGVSVSTKHVRKTIFGPTPASIVTCRRSLLMQAIETRFELGIQRTLMGGQ